MQAMSGLDAAFLYLEQPHMPMHVGSLCIFEGALKFDDFRLVLAQRMSKLRTFRQKLVNVPLSVDRPFWVDDPHFRLDDHLHHTALPAPGGWRELRRLCSRLFAQTLDRDRPLWEFVFVEGLNNIPQVPAQSTAIISKIHHAAIDGGSGNTIMSVLFDAQPIQPNGDAPEIKAAKPIPSDLELMAHSAADFVRRPFKLPSILLETARATLQSGTFSRVLRREMAVPFRAPHVPFNQPVDRSRLWNTAVLDLRRVKALKDLMKCTLNDVVLAICAGALRHYLLQRESLPEAPLVAMVPISTRKSTQRQDLGNQVDATLVELASQIEDPIERLCQIQRNMAHAKTNHKAANANLIMEYSELVPYGVAGQAARLYTRTELAKRHRPLFNCVITNVPGPRIPLYLAGHRMIASMGMAPIVDGVGLTIVVFSYGDLLTISPMSSPRVMPDLDVFARLLRESANELESAVQAHGAEAHGTD
ncbi:MAG: wax ester/triacylglycerol synthase family O-acyltransferase [Acidobacteria bacterium]|nr:wax ester/triacylglycerol synthase family O-acyltransferase [Acidobacteriota bacterium]